LLHPLLPALFHQELIVAPLGSGSRGNCTFVGTDRSGILVDCGLGPHQTFLRLAAIGLGNVRIEAVLVTHEHSDHVGGAAVLDRFLERRSGALVPFFFTVGTRRRTNEKCIPRNRIKVQAGRDFRVGRFLVEPVSVPHDTPEPVSYTVQLGDTRVGVITDLGRSTRLVEAQLASLDVAVLEFNHDLEMLLDGPYPWSLKQRIRGSHGHLSNEQSAELVVAGASARLRHVVLAHLSEDNNRPELAEEAAHRALDRAGRSSVGVTVAAQRTAHEPIRAHGEEVSARPRARVGRPRPAFRQDDAERQVSLFGGM
jgi:phosphoribosyl 1,2-cyclic phosphodiesterase